VGTQSHLTLPDGTTTSEPTSYAKTGNDGFSGYRFEAASKAGVVETVQFFLPLRLDGWKTVRIVTLSREDCERFRNAAKELPGTTITKLDEAARKVVTAPNSNAGKEALKGLTDAMNAAQPGKKFTPARNAALRELDGLNRQWPERITSDHLRKVRDAIQAKADDYLTILGKADAIHDPTSALFTNLKAKTAPELAALLPEQDC
jgi:hypothetical protein